VQGDYYRVKLDDGGELDALKVRPSSPGKKIQLSIRPERINVNAPEQGDQQVKARVQQFIYLGDHVRMLTEVAGQGNFMVKLSPAKMDSRWQPGSEVLLSWQPQHLRALDVVLQ